MQPLTLQRLLVRCAALAGVLFVVVVVALKLGAVPVSLYGLAQDLIRFAFHRTSALSSNYSLIIFDIRLPRILLGIFVGASLAVAGTSFQALLRNPLADPYVLGVSSGAAVGAILAVIIEPHLALSPEVATLLTPLGAFLGALATIAGVYLLGPAKWRNRQQYAAAFWNHYGVVFVRDHYFSDEYFDEPRPGRNGILVDGRFVDAAASEFELGDPRGILSGGCGDLYDGVGFEFAAGRGKGSDASGRGYQTRAHRGVCGGVDFDGAGGFRERHDRLCGTAGAAPDAADFGSDHRILLPAAAFGGAIAVVLADMLARTVVAPGELPVGAMTALVGAPLFIYLLRRRMT